MWSLLVTFIAGLIVAALIVAWRRPEFGLAILITGIALHNFALLVLVGSGVPEPVVRVLQLWKEVLIGVVLARLAVSLVRDTRAGVLSASLSRWRDSDAAIRTVDLAIAGFAALLLVYLVVPAPVASPDAPTVAQRLLGFRMLALIPIFYFLGRYLASRHRPGLQAAIVASIAAATLVAVFGLVELWFVPTWVWVDLGMPEFSALQGFAYRGPAGLPENFVLSTTSGLLLRRMVSTYLSPLGVAYTGLLVVPMVCGLLLDPDRRQRKWLWFALVIVLASIALSVTRLAIICLAIAAAIMAVLFRRRATSVTLGLTGVAIIMALVAYPAVGPLITFQLDEVRPPAGAALVRSIGDTPDSRPDPTPRPEESGPPASAPPEVNVLDPLLTGDDDSIRGHVKALIDGAPILLQHPLGLGLGAATYRFGIGIGPEESAILGIGGELGLLGLALFLIAYGGIVLLPLRAATRPHRPLDRALLLTASIGGVALLPVAMTSAVWGNFSVTYLFWAAAGASMVLVDRSILLPGTEATD
jgi:hypothetical protein